MKLIKVLVVLGTLVVAGGGFYLFQFSHSPANGTATNKVEFDLLKGMKPSEISASLEKAGLVSDARAMYWYGKLTRGWSNIKAADYELSGSMSPEQIFKTFKSGIGIQRALLVREGENIYQVAESFQNVGLSSKEEALKYLKSREFIAHVGLGQEGIRTLEGYLFPNTYFYDKRDTVDGVLKRMVAAFVRSWTPEYEARAKELGFTRKEIVTLASMIEKETGAEFERPIISSVFHNRLKKRMRLQSDPTTIYGMWERYTGNIHRSDLLTPSEYNTYTIPALPIGPISNPHAEAVKAALFPAATDYLYFVSKNDGTHMFSKTYEEHNGWVRKLQMDAKAREGKSWRNLKNNPTPQSETPSTR
jgi:UPF0755 protein